MVKASEVMYQMGSWKAGAQVPASGSLPERPLAHPPSQLSTREEGPRGGEGPSLPGLARILQKKDGRRPDLTEKVLYGHLLNGKIKKTFSSSYSLCSFPLKYEVFKSQY